MADLNPSGVQADDVSVSVVLPTYNERDNICDLVNAIQAQLDPLGRSYELLVMDDSSPDGTAQAVIAAYRLAAEEEGLPGGAAWSGRLGHSGSLRLVVRSVERGLAKAIRHGMELARGQTLVVMDTDFNHDPALIPQMVDFLRYYDLVIGSRFVMRGGMEDGLRYRLSQMYNVFIRTVLHTQIQDNLSGYFALRRSHFLELAPISDRIFYGYGDYFIRLLLVAWRKDWRILEVPVFYILRRHGTSKSGFWRIFRDYTRAVLRLWMRGL